MGALGGVGSIGVDVGGGVVCTLGLMGDGLGEAKFKKCSFLMGEENSSEDDELRIRVGYEQKGFILI